MPTNAELEAMCSRSTADIQGEYRYRLSRHWADGPHVLWIMLNPSTADAVTDDPTIRKCMGFARRWDRCGIVVVNLFAFRATDPKELPKARLPIGERNDVAIVEEAEKADIIVAAWGSEKFAKLRAVKVLELLRPFSVWCLFKNGDGSPAHPLYQPYERERIRL